MTAILLFLGLVLFIGLVVLHEFGHFVVARRNGVEVEEFGIGFPPAIWKKRVKSPKGDYNFTINLLPLGGFVKLKGEHDADKEPGSFGAADLWAKSKIMLAGVGLNLVAALVILAAVALLGMPKIINKNTLGEEQFTVASDTKVARNDVLINYVEENSPASKAGLKAGDQLLSIQGESVTTSEALPKSTKTRPGQDISIAYKRKGQVITAKTTLRTQQEVDESIKKGDAKGFLGVSPVDYTIQRSTWSAPVVAVGLSAQITKLTFKGLGTALKGLGSTIAGIFTFNKSARQAGQTEASSQVSGPLGIFFILKEGASRGFGFVLFIIGILSLTLAIMNVLPIPALDGGRFYLLLISRKLFKRPLPLKVEERIVGGSFVALILLFVLITFVDIHRFF
jgi:regulator of sigma E protease